MTRGLKLLPKRRRILAGRQQRNVADAVERMGGTAATVPGEHDALIGAPIVTLATGYINDCWLRLLCKLKLHSRVEFIHKTTHMNV